MTSKRQIGLMGMTQPFIQGTGLLVGLVMARFLLPSDYGVVAMVAGFTGLMSMVAGFGLSDAAVRRKELSQDEASSLFWLNALLGLGLCIAALSIGPLLAVYFDERLVVVIAAWAGASLLVNALSVQFRVQMIRGGRYGALSVADLGVQIVAGVAAVAMAVAGLGWRALVGLFMIQSVARLVGYVAISRWWPSLPHISEIPWDTVKLGAVVCAGWIMTALTATAESAALGRLGGAYDLGLYNRGMQLARYPVMVFFVPAFLPAVHRLSARQEDLSKMGGEHLRMLAWILLLASAPMGLLIGSGRDLIPLVMGEQWRPIVPLVAIAGVGLMGLPLAQATNWGLTAAGQKRRLFGYQLFLSVVAIGAVVGGAFAGGPVAMCVAFTVGMWALAVPMGLRLAGRYLGMGTFKAYRLAATSLILVITSAGTAYLAMVGLESLGADRIFRVAVALVAGGAAWFGIARFSQPLILREIIMTLSTTLHVDRSATVQRVIEWAAPGSEDTA